MSMIEIIEILWPASFYLSAFMFYILIISYYGYGVTARYAGLLFVIGFTVLTYSYPILLEPFRWVLSLVGFAAPVALSIIGIRYLVEEA